MSEYDFSISGVIKEALNRSDGFKWLFISSILVYILIEAFLKVGLILTIPVTKDFAGLIVLPITLPVITGIIILAIRIVRGEEVSLKNIFDYYPRVLALLGAYFLVVLVTLLGFILLILPGIYLSVSYVFTLSLVADKGLGVWEAMELSRKTVTQQWWKFFGLSLVILLIITLSIIPLGVGLVWSVPITYLTYGLLYHRLFDEEAELMEIQEETIEEIKER